MVAEALARMTDRDENMHVRIYPGPMAFVEELSARRESESEPTALPFFPYNQLQLGLSLLLLLPPVFSGETVVGARAYCRR